MLKKIVTFVSLLLLIGFYSCTDDGVTDAGTQPSPMGDWRLILLPVLSPAIPDTTTIYMSFESTGSETTFSIQVQQKTIIGTIDIYTSGGSYTENDTAVIVTGSDCMILNSETFQLEPLPDNVCSAPLAITTENLEETTWVIPGTTIALLPFLTDDQKTELAKIAVLFTKVD